MKPLALMITVLALLGVAAPAWGFAQDHAVWNQLLSQHVTWINGGTTSRVDYSGFDSDRAKLEQYLQSLSAVAPEAFHGWSKKQQLAFLINAYNAFTVKLIMANYPGIDSIKDLGSFFGLVSSPWSKSFFTLLGNKRTLDELEKRIRSYNDPRIHFAINCTAVSCPPLRPEAYVASRLDKQLHDQMVRFFSNESENRYDADSGTLRVSSIFDWYRDDFSHGYHGIDSIKSLFARFAELLADSEKAQLRIRSQAVPVEFLPYDWSLNDAAGSGSSE